MSINNIYLEVITNITTSGAYDAWRDRIFGDSPVTDLYQYLNQCAAVLNEQLGGSTTQLHEIGESYSLSIINANSQLSESSLRTLAEISIIDAGGESPTTNVNHETRAFTSFDIRRVDVRLWGLYGRTPEGVAQHIADLISKEAAVDLYCKLTGNHVYWVDNDVAITNLPQRVNATSDNNLTIRQSLQDQDAFEASTGSRQRPTQLVTLRVTSLAVMLLADGYSNSFRPNGTLAALEFRAGELRLLVWSDVNQAAPTHIISMHEALEINRDADALRE